MAGRFPRLIWISSLLASLHLFHLTACTGGVQEDQGAVVLTFDDAVKSHRTLVAPLLKELGFRATFFVTHRWMDDAENFMSWEDIAEIHGMGFEIGNHSWTHADFSLPRNAARLQAELALVEQALNRAGVPRPVSFAYSGNKFGPEAVKNLEGWGYRFARRGMQPEVPYGSIQAGPTWEPQIHHRLLIPTTGDAYPDWTLEHFQRLISLAQEGKIVVLQFHGVPDPAHPWVHTPPEQFREYMTYLKEQDLPVIALQDLEGYLPNEDPADPLLDARYSSRESEELELPAEMISTRADLDYWLRNMLQYHHYSLEEVQWVTGLETSELESRIAALGIAPVHSRAAQEELLVLPYPGGRHPRIGFLKGAVNPQRGTKASVFLPWDASGYIVVDLPEAIFSNRGLLYLAHTHIPTVWDEENLWLENIDWTRQADGSLTGSRTLPNGVRFGASIEPQRRQIQMELWLHNGSSEALSALRTQVCIMLKGAPAFNSQTGENKIFQTPVAAVQSADQTRWILTSWERCGRVWGNPEVPCIHSDPVLPDCPPGQSVRVRGRLWFSEGSLSSALNLRDERVK